MTAAPSVTPIFLFSLPRSGSTLVQRVLASHADVATASEPWLLLPFVYALRDRGVRSEYAAVPAARALNHFVEQLPGGLDDYLQELRSMAEHLYARAAAGRPYFLDKTPRYHFVVDEMFRIFPDARFLFLWRNPLAVVASIVQTWTRDRWGLGRWRADLFEGLGRLVAAYEANRDRAQAVRFEDLVSGPAGWPAIFAHLGLAYDPSVTSRFTEVQLDGEMGDKTGVTRYGGLSKEPIDRWQQAISNPFRKRWCRAYLAWIGERRLAVMGYDLDELIAQLEQIPDGSRRLGIDLAYRAYDEVAGRRRQAGLRA